MTQIKWIQNYLNENNQCSIEVNGAICGKPLGERSSTVKRHVKKIHPTLYAELTKTSVNDSIKAFTHLANFIGTSTASISYLSNPSFKVIFL